MKSLTNFMSCLFRTLFEHFILWVTLSRTKTGLKYMGRFDHPQEFDGLYPRAQYPELMADSEAKLTDCEGGRVQCVGHLLLFACKSPVLQNTRTVVSVVIWFGSSASAR
jgi:hypothetical protein